jgi:hypothetical protein
MTLEIRPFDGEPLTVSAWTCSGIMNLSCQPSMFEGARARREYRDCGPLPVILEKGQSLAVNNIVFYLDLDSAADRLRRAGAQDEYACDNDCELEARAATSGWIMPEEMSEVRKAARFELHFGDASIAGDFDTTVEGPVGE